MKNRKAGYYKIKDVTNTAECAFQRAIIQGRYSFIKGEKIKWIDIELPVDDSLSKRGECVDLIGKDSKGNYVLCELKFRKRSDHGSPSLATTQLKNYYENIKKNAVELNRIKLGHINASERIDWEKVASPTTRLMVVANDFYWDTWLIRSRKKERLTDKNVEYYSVNVDRFEFEKQLGDNKNFAPIMPKGGIEWIEKH